MQDNIKPVLILVGIVLITLIILVIVIPREPAIEVSRQPTVTAAVIVTQNAIQPTADGTVSPETPSPSPSLTPTPNGPRDFYAAANGTPDGDGSLERPWDLETALDQPATVKAGDTIWLQEGFYDYRSLDYLYSRLEGEEGKPITVRAIPGHRVTIDAAISIRGSWTTLWGLEVIESTENRNGVERKDGISDWGEHTKLINNVVHDTDGVGFWWQAAESEMYGNLIYNSGFQGTDRGHGHNLYTTNKTGMKQINDNIMFNTFSDINIHAYSEKTYLNGFHIEGNVLFNAETLVGGLVPAENVELIGNYFYNGPVRLGYQRGVDNSGLLVEGNYFQANGEALKVSGWKDVHFGDNTLWQRGFPWANIAGLFTGQPLKQEKPQGVEVFVRPNKYEPKRGHIIVYNWVGQDQVQVDITSLGLEPGDHYTLHNAQNYFDESIVGAYDGSPVSIPMTGWSVALPIGWPEPLAPSTFPEFGVFVLTSASN